VERVWRASGEGRVIRLTRINRTSLAINGDLIKFVESAPDTVITLITGEKVVVTESVEQIIDLIVQFRRTILTGAPCPALALHGGTSSHAARMHGRSEGRAAGGRTL
jgi:flagellar protein FlbD